jgi:hypothetical protein
MTNHDDPQYLKLRLACDRAAQAYENALAHRKRLRAAFAERAQRASQTVRRPVGSPATFRIPQPAAAPPPATLPRSPPAKIYLGPILGWAKVIGPWQPAPELGPEDFPDEDAAHDAISLKLYWDAKIEYERCRKALLEYQNRRDMQLHRQKARAALSHTANLQLLGVESDDAIAEARREVEAACQNAWEIYQNSPTPRSRALTVLLLESLADAQLVGAETATIRQMQHEMDRLIGSGEVQREE